MCEVMRRGKGSAAVDFGGDVKLNPEETYQRMVRS